MITMDDNGWMMDDDDAVVVCQWSPLLSSLSFISLSKTNAHTNSQGGGRVRAGRALMATQSPLLDRH